MNAMDERVYARLEWKMSFGGIAYITKIFNVLATQLTINFVSMQDGYLPSHGGEPPAVLLPHTRYGGGGLFWWGVSGEDADHPEWSTLCGRASRTLHANSRGKSYHAEWSALCECASRTLHAYS